MGTSSPMTMSSNDVLTPLVIVANIINDWTLRKATTSYSVIDTFWISKTIWALWFQKRTQTLFYFDRLSISFLVCVNVKIIYVGTVWRRKRKNRKNLLCECSVLQGWRHFKNLEYLNAIPLMSSLRFIKITRRMR